MYDTEPRPCIIKNKKKCKVSKCDSHDNRSSTRKISYCKISSLEELFTMYYTIFQLNRLVGLAVRICKSVVRKPELLVNPIELTADRK